MAIPTVSDKCCWEIVVNSTRPIDIQWIWFSRSLTLQHRHMTYLRIAAVNIGHEQRSALYGWQDTLREYDDHLSTSWSSPSARQLSSRYAISTLRLYSIIPSWHNPIRRIRGHVQSPDKLGLQLQDKPNSDRLILYSSINNSSTNSAF